ncbi:MAG: hypothetical protein Q4A07_10100 [Coriobacteriales bacterium]|nr:hypothetical protein [Coriobacteriales bacterium]
MDPSNESLSISRQCELLRLPRSSYYARPKAKGAEGFTEEEERAMRIIVKRGQSGPMRMVLSNYYTGFSGEDESRVFKRFVDELDGQGFTEAWFIKKDGSILVAR